MLNHQKRKNQQNAGSASKSKVSAAEASSNQDKAAEDDMSSNARAYPCFMCRVEMERLPCIQPPHLVWYRPMEWQR
jgi:hypothetical protein